MIEMETFIKQNLFGKNPRIALLAILLFSLLVGFTFGQSKPHEDCDEKSKPQAKAAKKPPAPPKHEREATLWVVAPAPPARVAIVSRSRRDVSEKTIAVHAKVYVSLCVSSGNVKVNGWNREEVRAFVDGGSKVSFKVRETKGDEETPVWIEVLGSEATGRGSGGPSIVRSNFTGRGEGVGSGAGCLSGKSIELDLPRNAALKMKGNTGETTIDSLRWVDVNNTGGRIFVSRISNGVNAQTFRGNVTVKNSGGKMQLGAINGDVIAYKTETNEIGDYLKAKTQGGSITLQSVEQRDVKVNSVSGGINFVGKLANYGRYSFDTGYGAINLAIPSDTSCTVEAQYGGYLKSDFPIKVTKKGQYDTVKSLIGKIGEGSCNLAFKTFNGSILIRKLDTKRQIASSSQFNQNFRFSSQEASQ